MYLPPLAAELNGVETVWLCADTHTEREVEFEVALFGCLARVARTIPEKRILHGVRNEVYLQNLFTTNLMTVINR